MHHNGSIRVAPAQASTGDFADGQNPQVGGSVLRPIPSASSERGKMVAKWQQWMPFRIDAFKSSPAVQAMCSSARSGYLYLLACAWQTEDCTIPNDPILLAEMSGMGDELWVLHGPRILRKFHPIEGTEKLRNDVCYQEWLEAKRVFDSRRQAADRTNTARSPRLLELQSPDGHRVAVPCEALRSADTRTTVVPVPVNVPVSLPLSDSGSELALAAWIFEEANVPCDNPTVAVAGDCIRKLAKDAGIGFKDAADVILAEVKGAILEGEIITRFWFSNQRYKPQLEKKARVPKIAAPPAPGQRSAEETAAYAMWESMSEEYRKANPWRAQ